MEQNVPVSAKRIWSIVRVAFFMLRKGLSKRSKLMLDLNMMMKRGKIASKALSNLMFNHHHRNLSSAPREYEFSCSNTPNFAFPINNKRRNQAQNHHSHFFACAHSPQTLDDDVATVNAVKAVLAEMLNNDVVAEASPALPGFGRSPMVRQLRITDSPFPLRDTDEDCQVDKAAEEFIQRFYRQLRQQKGVAE